jgi:NitT/TauT family transport system substrate-binding protein
MLAALAALIAGCWRNEGASTAPQGESVTVAMPLALHSALVLLAVEKRYFAEQGLNVSVNAMASGAAAIDALERRQADFALSSETTFVLAALDKKNVRLLATLYRSRANTSMIARKDSGIVRPPDLAGRRIGVIANTSADYFVDLYLELQGIESGAITRVALDADQAGRALLEGDVDAVALFHPYSSRLIVRLGEQAVVLNEPEAYKMQFNLVARPDFTDARPETARRFILALQNALTFLRENAEAARRLTIDATKEDPVAFAKVWQVSDFSLELNQSLFSLLEDEARWALARRAAAPVAPPNFLEFIDVRPLRSAVPGAVSMLLP